LPTTWNPHVYVISSDVGTGIVRDEFSVIGCDAGLEGNNLRVNSNNARPSVVTTSGKAGETVECDKENSLNQSLCVGNNLS
jgi:hypothetical protein